MEQGAILLHSAFRNLFYVVLDLIATLIILAIPAANSRSDLKDVLN